MIPTFLCLVWWCRGSAGVRHKLCLPLLHQLLHHLRLPRVEPLRGRHHGQLRLPDPGLVHPRAPPPGGVRHPLVRVRPRRQGKDGDNRKVSCRKFFLSLSGAEWLMVRFQTNRNITNPLRICLRNVMDDLIPLTHMITIIIFQMCKSFGLILALAVLYNAPETELHCKYTGPKNLIKYSQKWNWDIVPNFYIQFLYTLNRSPIHEFRNFLTRLWNTCHSFGTKY